MKNLRNLTLGLLLAGLSLTGVDAQVNNRVSAKNAMDDFGKLQQSNPAGAKNKLLEAKKYIDLAAAHDETKNDPKTLFYKGQIYFYVSMLSGAKDEQFVEFDAEATGKEAFAAWKSAMANKNKKYDPKEDIYRMIFVPHTMSYQMGAKAFEKQKYDSAALYFESCYELMNVMEVLDTLSCFNAGLAYDYHGEALTKKCGADKSTDCPEANKMYNKSADMFKICADAGYQGSDLISRYAEVLTKAGKKDEAKAVIQAGRAKYPKNSALAIAEFNYYLSIGDNEGAEKALAEAIKINPKDALLYFNAGAIYDEMKRYDDAKKAYENAIAINPNYFDAYFNLGAMYYNRAVDIYKAINDIKDNAVYDKEKARADELFKEAIAPLEKARTLNSKDKNNLIMLRTIYARLNMQEKWSEVDKAIKNG
ncbi:MAG: tetratricopeptide repeat protein [Flavobacteriales bacterium]